MMATSYDTIVVGLGAIGSATLYQLAKRGQRVLGVEMFQPGHDQGSSHGYHRMIRMSAVFADGYTPLAERALDLWHILEEESGETLLRLLGEIHLVDPASYPEYPANAVEMSQRGLWQILSADDLVERFPGVRLRDHMLATYEAKAGFLRSEAGILSHVAVAGRHGAEVRTGAEVTGWAIDGTGVRVTTATETFTADRLVITTGPWASELLSDLGLPLRVERVVNGYFEPSRPDWWSAEQGAPDFLLSVPEGSFYGMPAVEGVGLKIGLSGGFGLGVTTARTIDRHVDDAEIDFLRNVLDTYMPGASGPALRHVTCMCTYTPDKGFVVDRHASHEQVLIGCGFSGRGYKFAPTIGEILADLATDGSTRHEIGFMSATRFGS
jgi:sarcosine oxidase